MAALKPAIIHDAIELITLYKKSESFRNRFDAAIRRSIDVTYKHRPLKLYFEVLASSSPKFEDEYQKVRRLIKYDTEGLIKNTLLAITPADLSRLRGDADQAEKKINALAYPDREVDKLNQIEESSQSPDQKYQKHKKRLEETEYLRPAPKVPTAEEAKEAEKEETIEKPKEIEEKPVLKEVLVGPGGEPIRHIRKEEAPVPAIPSIPKPPSIKVVSRVQEFITSPSTFVRNVIRGGGARAAAGRAVAAGIGKTAFKVGASTVAKAGAGMIARLSISTVLSTVFGVATGGIGFVIGMLVTLISLIITTFSKQIKEAFRMILWATVGIITFIIFMFISNWGIKMNSLLPPYKVAYAEPVPSVSPSPSISPSISPSPTPIPGADTASCPLQNSSGISCGSYGTNYSGCPGGHCSSSYNAGLPPSSQCSPTDSRLPHSIDVAASAGTLVYLPTINGKFIAWTYIGSNSVTGDSGGGLRFMFTAHIETDDWLLYLTHVNPSQLSLSIGNAYQSGEAVATVYLNQIHVNIGKKTPSDSDTVWINPESLGMCI